MPWNPWDVFVPIPKRVDYSRSSYRAFCMSSFWCFTSCHFFFNFFWNLHKGSFENFTLQNHSGGFSGFFFLKFIFFQKFIQKSFKFWNSSTRVATGVLAEIILRISPKVLLGVHQKNFLREFNEFHEASLPEIFLWFRTKNWKAKKRSTL